MMIRESDLRRNPWRGGRGRAGKLTFGLNADHPGEVCEVAFGAWGVWE